MKASLCHGINIHLVMLQEGSLMSASPTGLANITFSVPVIFSAVKLYGDEPAGLTSFGSSVRNLSCGPLAGLAGGGKSGAPPVKLEAGPVILVPAVILDPAAAGLAGCETGDGCALASCCSGRKLVAIASITILTPKVIAIVLCFFK